MAKKADVVPISRFRRSDPLAGVPEIQMVPDADRSGRLLMVTPTPSVDLGSLPKVWFLIGNGSVGKTTYARWLIWRMMEQGREAMLAALDPGTRALTSWFGNVEQPAGRGSIQTEKFLADYIDFVRVERSSALLDFGAAGDVALRAVVESVGKLHTGLEEDGLGVVACHILSPRIWDIDPLTKLEAAGFQPQATLLVLNEGKVDSVSDPAEAFAPILRHSAYRAAIDRGAIPLWLPALDGEVMAEIELKQLHWGMAANGQVPAGAAFSPIGGLRRSKVNRWLERMDAVHAPIASWLP